MEDGNQKRRGLVLAGGGAKGAYSFGCLVALRRLGYRFDVVAGTSVGALNAALWSTNSLSSGFRIWKGLSFDTTYSVQLAGRFSPRIIWVLSSIYVILQLFRGTLNREKHQGEAWIALVLAIVMAAISGSIFFYLKQPGIWNILDSLVLGLVLAGYTVVLIVAILNKFDNQKMLIIWGPATAIALSAPVEMIIPALVASILSLALIGHLLGFLSRWVITRFSRFSAGLFVFSSAPLRDAVSEILRSRKFCGPTYATSAVLRDRIDFRGEIDWEPIAGDHRYANEPLSLLSKDFERRAVRPVRRRIWLPEYDDLSELGSEEAIDKLMASAALPFGLVKSVEFFGFQHVDGGVVDNLPWHPLIAHGLDEIFVLMLEPFENDDDALDKAGATPRQWFARELENYVSPFSDCAILPEEAAEMEETMRLAYDRFGHSYLEFIEEVYVPPLKLFYPLSNIGGFIDGTLRFESSFARNLIRQGINDTYSRLASENHSNSEVKFDYG